MVAQLVSGRQFAKVHFASKELPRNVHTTQVVKEQRTVVVGTTNSLKTESSLADRNSKPSTTGKIVGHTVETVFYKEANDCPEQTIVRSIPVMEYPNIGNANPEMGSYNEKVTNWSGYLVGSYLEHKEQESTLENLEEFDLFLDDDPEEYGSSSIADPPIYLY